MTATEASARIRLVFWYMARLLSRRGTPQEELPRRIWSQVQLRDDRA